MAREPDPLRLRMESLWRTCADRLRLEPDRVSQGHRLQDVVPGERMSSAVMSRPRKYPDELRERAVRLVFESKRPIAHVAPELVAYSVYSRLSLIVPQLGASVTV
jgi:hypothetical protein